MTKPDLSLIAFFKTISSCTLIAIFSSCATPYEVKPADVSTPIPSVTIAPSPLPVIPRSTYTPISPEPAPTVFVCNDNWQSLPVIPIVSEVARRLYQRGAQQGNDPHAFSKIGDGEISTTWFLTDFDLSTEYYDLGEYQHLSVVIENFQGSFARKSLAARRGFNTNRIMDPFVNDPTFCNPDESPLECELRFHNPSIAFLSFGTNQAHRPEEFEVGARRILDLLISRNILPILSTKGDNLEGNHAINHTIACLAQEYQIPLWNFWVAIQPLPDHGLQPDLEHLTFYGSNDFDDPLAMRYAWAIRNLSALQVLDVVWRSVKK